MSSRLPWTKFQDFYLRLGFLETLVAALSHERRSATNDAVIRRLERPLFDSVVAYPTLRQQTAELFATAYPRKTSSGKRIEAPEVAEALAGISTGNSALYGITRETAYKIVDWAHDVGFAGQANQISERALVLRSLLPREPVERFLAGDVSAWNPFQLDLRARLFFTFHLIETDLLTVELVRDLGALPAGTVLEARGAAQMTCAALLRILQATENRLDARDIPAHRTAVELAITMADEVEAPLPPEWGIRAQQARTLHSIKTASRRNIRAQLSGKPPRKTTKNADHQTIPRFEQLVDLGFLSKPDIDPSDPVKSLAARRRWRYVPTEACRRWARAANDFNQESVRFQWATFAKVAVEAFHGHSVQSRGTIPPNVIGERLWHAYVAVGRPVGMTPADSVALRATIDAVADGLAIELCDFHNFLLKIKEHNIFTDSVFFGSGNALDAMFIRLKPRFLTDLSTSSALSSEFAR